MAVATGLLLGGLAAQGIGSVIKAKKQSSAAKKAAEEQVRGTQEASGYTREALGQLGQLYNPYINRASAISGTIGRLMTPGAGARFASPGPPNAMPQPGPPPNQAVPRGAMPPMYGGSFAQMGPPRGGGPMYMPDGRPVRGPYPMAEGGDMHVTEPTMFLAGEAGPERATFQPVGGGQGGAAPPMYGDPRSALGPGAGGAAPPQMPDPSDPFAAMGGGVQMNGGWVPRNHPMVTGDWANAAPPPRPQPMPPPQPPAAPPPPMAAPPQDMYGAGSGGAAPPQMGGGGGGNMFDAGGAPPQGNEMAYADLERKLQTGEIANSTPGYEGFPPGVIPIRNPNEPLPPQQPEVGGTMNELAVQAQERRRGRGRGRRPMGGAYERGGYRGGGTFGQMSPPAY